MIHIDPFVQQAWNALSQEICSFERSTGRQYTLVVIPHNSSEPIMVSVNGKPVGPEVSRTDPEVYIDEALKKRKNSMINPYPFDE